MHIEHHASLFRNGRNQAVRIPREFEFKEKEGERLIIEPIRRNRLGKVLASLKPLEEDFPEIIDIPPRVC